MVGCRSPARHAAEADRAASAWIEQGQQKTLGRTEPFTLERPSDTLRRRLLQDQALPGLQAPEAAAKAPPLADPLILSLHDALRIGAANSRAYQAAKEAVFEAALSLDLQADAFRTSFAGALAALFSEDRTADPDSQEIAASGSAGVSRKLKAGATLSTRLAIDLAKLLTADKDSSFGLALDASISMPLLRGAGRALAAEPLTQAERNLVYAIRSFERYKQEFAVSLASGYLSVLQQAQAVQDASSNLARVRDAYDRAARLADAGRMPGIQVDQARQDVLRAESRLNGVRQSFESRLDTFKLTLGLPTDARLELVREELTSLVGAKPDPAADKALPISESNALALAFANRLDFQTETDQVADAERALNLARDALRAGLTLKAAGSLSDRTDSLSAGGLSDLSVGVNRGRYEVGLSYDAPWERTAERNAYRSSLLALDRARRNLEAAEDQLKLEVRNGLRNLAEAREAVRIQALAVEVARSRVASTEIYLQAGRAEIRDLLEAQDALISAQDALTDAVVTRRLSELNLQRHLGVLEVNPEGLWREYEYPKPLPAAE